MSNEDVWPFRAPQLADTSSPSYGNFARHVACLILEDPRCDMLLPTTEPEIFEHWTRLSESTSSGASSQTTEILGSSTPGETGGPESETSRPANEVSPQRDIDTENMGQTPAQAAENGCSSLASSEPTPTPFSTPNEDQVDRASPAVRPIESEDAPPASESSLRRSSWRGYLRSIAVAILCNSGDHEDTTGEEQGPRGEYSFQTINDSQGDGSPPVGEGRDQLQNIESALRSYISGRQTRSLGATAASKATQQGWNISTHLRSISISFLIIAFAARIAFGTMHLQLGVSHSLSPKSLQSMQYGLPLA